MSNNSLSRTIRASHSKRDQGKCPFCGIDVRKMLFNDELSLAEFRISGLCQVCQDETFKEEA